MKVLFNCPLPFSLAHGGQATQIQQTMAALAELGVEVEPIRWWDDRQTGDVIHYFGRMPSEQIRFAQAKGFKVVLASLLSAACNRTDHQLRRSGWALRLMERMPLLNKIPKSLDTGAYQASNLNLVGLEAERRVLELMFHVPLDKVKVVPLGLDKIFLKARPADRDGDYLICPGTITRVKNSVLLARLAHAAQIPILFVGKPYSESDPYWIEFKTLIDGDRVRYHGYVSQPSDLVGLLQKARGAVIMSQFENWCLAAHEAAGCGLPVLLPPKRWACERFGDQAQYFESVAFNPKNTALLGQFYRAAPKLPKPDIRLFSWRDTALQLREIYQSLLKS